MSHRVRGMRRWVPETVGTSSMDCGPAALTSLLAGFGLRVPYDRLRDACQTDVDGTSIDRIEDVARQLGLDAEQIMLPPEQLTLPESGALPCIAVVTQPGGATHFIVVWRRVGRWLQVMDPAVGRRWMTIDAVRRQLYVHGLPVPAGAWRGWIAGPGHRPVIEARLARLGLRGAAAAALIERADALEDHRGWAALDAAIRVIAPVVEQGALRRGAEAGRAIDGLMGGLLDGAVTVPPETWSAWPMADGQVMMRGAVLVRVRGLRDAIGDEAHGTPPDGSDASDGSDGSDGSSDDTRDTHAAPEAAPPLDPDAARALRAALSAPTRPPLRRLLGLLLADGARAPALVALGVALSAAVTVFEATLLRGLVDALAWIGPPEQRMVALGALVAFFVAAVALELPVQIGLLRLGRRTEMRLRLALRRKLPRLADRYLRSRPLSDLAERAHGVSAVGGLPGLAAGVVRAASGLLFTAAGLVWLDPGLWPIVALTGVVGLLLPLLSVPILAERDLRFRTHAGALTRYSLDALFGLSAIRTHGGQRAIRRRHEALLTEWADSALGLERLALAVEGALAVAGAGIVGWLLWDHLARATDTRGVLLLVWWGLALPGRARALVDAVQAWPAARNQALRLLEPLDAPEVDDGIGEMASDGSSNDSQSDTRDDIDGTGAIGLDLDGVGLRAGSATILDGVDVRIAPGEHVAVVGRSGAGKSSLFGLILGLSTPAAGEVRADGRPLVGPAIPALRRRTAWVDPTTRIWNRSLLDNLRYDQPGPVEPGPLLDGAELRPVLARLPDGLQSRLGEGGGLLSGGEGQRVRLGRAMAAPAPGLVLLDEPFRGLDRPRRRRLLAGARRRWADATLVCVTHDLAETRAFDRVVVLDGGRVVEDGAPAALLAAGGLYAELMATEARLDAIWRDDRWQHRRLVDGRLREGPPDATDATDAMEGAA